MVHTLADMDNKISLLKSASINGLVITVALSIIFVIIAIYIGFKLGKLSYEYMSEKLAFLKKFKAAIMGINLENTNNNNDNEEYISGDKKNKAYYADNTYASITDAIDKTIIDYDAHNKTLKNIFRSADGVIDQSILDKKYDNWNTKEVE